MKDLIDNYNNLKKMALEQEFSRMNDMQKEAIFNVEGPLLILAGAGSGKTTVLVNRIAYMIKYGNAYNSQNTPFDLSENTISDINEALSNNNFSCLGNVIANNPIKPWKILAITFTNKAAGELKDRLIAMLGDDGNDIWASTFHSTCAKILRKNCDRLGYTNHFTVYDSDDQKRLIKDCQKQFSIDDKILSYRAIISEISKAKDQMLSPDEYAQTLEESDSRGKKIASVYSRYQERLKSADAMDFDDLLYMTVKLFRENGDVLDYYQNRFGYILVDEYQDTNGVQFEFINLLANKHNNLCVVGDDDQSIYKFRGANIKNILDFEKNYPNAKVIRLEQNYRSTQNILDSANAVIMNNSERKGKNLWTQNGVGQTVSVNTYLNEQSEAKFIAETILKEVATNKANYSDFAVLYRMNAQSNIIERMFAKMGIPYRVIGGLRFYDRKEIKDMIAYLSVIANPSDEIRLKRIINEPKRSIGDKTVATATQIATLEGVPLYSVLQRADEYEALKRSASKIMTFTAMMDGLIDMAQDEEVDLGELYDEILEQTKIKDYYLAQGDEAITRIENIQELKSHIVSYQEENGVLASLTGFLEEVSLYTDIDNYDNQADSTILMTLHAAKGLEFSTVFMPGMEENIFPSFQVINGDGDVQEERRLAYVGITRARKKLYITNAVSRLVFGSANRNKLSRFATEIPEELIDRFVERDWRQLEPDQNKPKSAKENRVVTTSSARNIGIGVHHAQNVTKFAIGDTVSHKTFGTGLVILAKPMGNDMLLEIAFEKVGTKKLMANFAQLIKL